MDSRYVKFDGILTHYLEGGPVDARTVVLIHDGAFGSDPHTTWGPLMDMLASRYHVYAPELLGFGQTSKLFDFGKDHRRQRIEHAARWMDALRIDQADFVGSSMGGSLVLIAAAERSWPFRKGVSIAGTGGPHTIAARYAELQDYHPSEDAMRRIVEIMVNRRDAFFEQLVRDRYQNSMMPGHWESLSAARLKNPAAPKASMQWLDDYYAALSKMDTPILLVAGGDDILLEPGWQDQLAARMPNGRAHVIPGGKHQPHLDDPEGFQDLLVKFLEA